MDIYWEKAGRRLLRILSAIVLVFYVTWRICIPIISGDLVVLDKNDGYVILGSIAMLICIEAWVMLLKKIGSYGKN